MEAGFTVGNRNDVVVDLALFEVGVDTLEFDIGSTFFRAAAILEHLFQIDAGVACCSYSAFAPLASCQYWVRGTQVKD